MSKQQILLFVLVSFSIGTYGQADRKYIRQGNKQYENGSFDESEVSYRKALDKNTSSYAGDFNLGDALYKQEKYEEAVNKFSTLSGNETDKQKLGQIYHNLGNSLLKANQIEESIEAYKNALRNNPTDIETKHNLAYALSLLQQQQQQQQSRQNQDQQNQQQDQKNSQDQQEQKAEQNEQESQEQPLDQISKEDAQRILEALKQDEQKLQERLKKQLARTKRVKVLKDW